MVKTGITIPSMATRSHRKIYDLIIFFLLTRATRRAIRLGIKTPGVPSGVPIGTSFARPKTHRSNFMHDEFLPMTTPPNPTVIAAMDLSDTLLRQIAVAMAAVGRDLAPVDHIGSPGAVAEIDFCGRRYMVAVSLCP